MTICRYKSILIFSDFIIGCAFSDSGANEHLILLSLSAQKKIVVKLHILICISLWEAGKHTLSNAEQTFLQKVMLTIGKLAGVYNSIHLSSSINLTVLGYVSEVEGSKINMMPGVQSLNLKQRWLLKIRGNDSWMYQHCGFMECYHQWVCPWPLPNS